MRVIRGKLKSVRFNPPKGFPSRPTTDFAKEGLFNMLENQRSLINLNILDLCSGTGNITLEFASREAGFITAVDKNFSCVRFVYNLAKQHNLLDEIQTYKSEAVKFLNKTEDRFDIIFTDPPFALSVHENIHKAVFERALLTLKGILIIEHGKETKLDHLEYFQYTRKYGNVCFSFFGAEN